MARFSYQARRPNGEKVIAVQEAGDARALAAALREEGLVPIAITEVGAPTAAQAKQRRRGGRPKLRDVAPFVRQVSVLLQAGVGLVTALDDLARQIEKTSFAEIVMDLRNKVMGGTPLSGAMADHRQVFPDLVCAMVRAGEESGHLEHVMADLATYLESQLALRRAVVGALVYPAFIACVFCLVGAVLFLFVVPSLEATFRSLGADLPFLTRALLGSSVWLRHWILPLLLALVCVAIGLKAALRIPRVREARDALTLRLPVIGALALKVVLVRVLETLATLQRSGVSILRSLEIASATAGNKIVGDALAQARIEVMHGSSLSREMAKTEIFPPMLVRMVAVGEQTGSMDALLTQTASFYREEVDIGIRNATRLIEPIMIILLAVLVGLVVLAVYLPIFSLSGSIR